MRSRSAKVAFAASALLGSVQAHTRFTTLFVDGANQGDAVCVRMDMDGERTNSPIAGVQSPEMACGKTSLSLLLGLETLILSRTKWGNWSRSCLSSKGW